MKIFALAVFVLFSSFVSANDTLMVDSFSRFGRTVDNLKASHWYVLDSLQALISASKVKSDKVGSKDLSMFGAYVNQFGGSNPLYSDGNSLIFDTDFEQLTQLLTDPIYGIRVVFKPTNTITSATSFKFLLNLEGLYWGVSFGSLTGSFSDELITLNENLGNNSYWASATDSISNKQWNILFIHWDSSLNKYQIWLNGAKKNTSITGTPQIITMDTVFKIGVRGDNAGSFKGRISDIKIYDSQLSDVVVKNETFAPENWTSLNGGVVRADSLDSYKFALGVNADTVYCETQLEIGSWSVFLQDSSESSYGYELLTSIDKTNWVHLASGNTSPDWSEQTFSGNGLGYIAIASPNIIYIDNIVVVKDSIIDSASEPQMHNKHKKHFTHKKHQ